VSSPDKREVEAVVVKLLHHRQTDRGMTLAHYETRCVRLGEIHELVTTDEPGGAGGRIDRVGFLGFVEVTRPGVLEVGDEVVHRGRSLGRVLGFDECHFPNHYNILVASERTLAAEDAGLQVEDTITFRIGTARKET
jgi:L-arabinose 1- dehydrogenase